MRASLLILLGLLGLVSCGSGKAEAEREGSGSESTKHTDKLAREQAQFDAQRRPEKVIEALGIKPGSRVADIGAGSGLLTIHLARAVAPNGKVVATDINREVLDLLMARLSAANLAEVVEARVVGADKPELEANTYDAILLAEVDHYFTDPVAWLKSATASLRPGGRIVLSNRIHRNAKSMAAAAKAGLVLKSETTPVPTHFIAVFVAPGGSK
ncbi:MAG: class I SAM-dependent methyltransferase [Deltaproteobacteria bacterium]|nr:class I SAM-dependent methyltransferase [Deltaproteobacteria bacterium]